MLLVIEYSWVNSFLLIFISFKCALLKIKLNLIWFDLIEWSPGCGQNAPFWSMRTNLRKYTRRTTHVPFYKKFNLDSPPSQGQILDMPLYLYLQKVPASSDMGSKKGISNRYSLKKMVMTVEKAEVCFGVAVYHTSSLYWRFFRNDFTWVNGKDGMWVPYRLSLLGLC